MIHPGLPLIANGLLGDRMVVVTAGAYEPFHRDETFITCRTKEGLPKSLIVVIFVLRMHPSQNGDSTTGAGRLRGK